MKRINMLLKMSEVRTERQDDCIHYNSCLTIAANHNWSSFSCSNCEQYYRTTKFQPDKLSRVATPLADTFN